MPTKTTTSDRADAGTVLVPVSRAVARLLHQLQAEMIKETHGLATVPPGAIVLPGVDGAKWQFSGDDTHEVLTIGGDGNSDRFTKRWLCPDSWKNSCVPWHQSHRRLNMDRTDAAGREFSHSGEVYVMDDFGSLVEVAA